MKTEGKIPALLNAALAQLAIKIAPLVRDELLAALTKELKKYLDSRGGQPLRQMPLDPSIGADLMARIEAAINQTFKIKQSSLPQAYVPSAVMAGTVVGDYMAASNALARDFLHPAYKEFCRLFGMPLLMHRKFWEWAFIYEQLKKADVLRPGTRGIGFGVGNEKLPAFFAGTGAHITATDAIEDISGWREFGSHSSDVEQLFCSEVISRELFDTQVSFEPCDMNAIPSHLNNYDFCWSSCSMEHLGSLQHGIDFVVNSIEQTLRIGGIACHTTELNLSSDDETLELEDLVLYRRQDLERLCRLLSDRGHQVDPLRLEPGNLPPDYLVDVPPYGATSHLKLLVGSYVVTSVGIVARRGR